MWIEVLGESSISRQARTYAEYRVFAALSQVADAGRVRQARVILRRHAGGRVSCRLVVETEGTGALRIHTFGDHPSAAINRAVERLKQEDWPARGARRVLAAAE